MRTTLVLTASVALLAALTDTASGGEVVELKADHVVDIKGDGPDGKGNTGDDTWQFWFELVKPKGKFLHLDLATLKMPQDQREKGIPGKVDGPIAKDLPNPKDTEGWIYHSDWNGKFEGAWGDTKTGKAILHPYVEKRAHRACALSYKVPKSGTYKITGAVTDGNVWKHKLHKGFICKVGAGVAQGKSMTVTKLLAKTGVIGDKVGPDSGTFKVDSVELEKDAMIVVLVDPNGWWGSDVMVVDSLKIEFLGEAKPRPAGNALAPEIAADPTGDGPDGKGNTGDDTWQFWFQIMHDRNLFLRLDLATKIQPEAVRTGGIRRKVWGPLAGTLPNPKDTEGWIYHSDWDGKREGVWGDAKAKQVLVVPYQEKGDGGAICVTYKVPADGAYIVSGKATDLEIDKEHNLATGAKVLVDIVAARDGKSIRTGKQVLVEPIPFGDKLGPESVQFKSDKVTLKKGQLVRLVIDPVKVAYKDVTRVAFNIRPAK